ncbi:transcription factor [Candidatus Woesearchaeota archaeon]|jgi:transcription initiation factor TFIIE subunit alpha|nr:transcription factor [Candidatus Woesearchaeota archaeon]MBT4368732.1 transcription factor [Candidatus Woesearchaeota archaeon]MBT4712021.1 transcription factor [Candidatus Woesearchaeota archaeon]MBT6638916.1 transcription factor [Candidatus Woesearchaeota archaeon]MBT7134560.1 transcription factor [Candidatus Woesearchaeota archaeon]
MAKSLTKKLITDVVAEAVGEDALPIYFYLKTRKDISEFKIADDTKTEIHAVRNILYRLHNESLVTYRRKKDKEKGWYISYWTPALKRVLELVEILKNKKLVKFKERLEKEEENEGNYFMCPQACVRMEFYTATEHEFKCPECGSLLNQQDNTKTIERLKTNIKKLESNA